MVRVFRIIVAASAVLASLLLVSPVAAAGTGANFGAHVSECARAGMFSGDHNPGMHQGFSAWLQ
ncbi:MAG: hypothetical protein ACOYXS_08055 [Chloroflexota bacterium]